MKTKIYTTVSTIMLFIPWGLLFLRRYDWALQMPMAKILISGCAALMIAGGVFSVIVYAKGNVPPPLDADLHDHPYALCCCRDRGVLHDGNFRLKHSITPGSTALAAAADIIDTSAAVSAAIIR